MRFIIAPDWLMAKDDDDLLLAKTVVDLYGYKDKLQSGNAAYLLMSNNSIPMPDVITPRGRKTRNLRWSVRHIKNNMKLPTELLPTPHKPAVSE